MKKAAAGAASKARHAGGAAKGASARNTSRSAPRASDEAPSRGTVRADQLGAIVAKGLDLAEASLSLGLTMINRVGNAAQQQVERMMRAVPQEGAPDPATQGYAPSPAAPPPSPGAPVSAMGNAPVAEEPLYAITNRMPVAPGAAVRIPFSINNDSVSSAKTVVLKAVGFVGEADGAQIDAAQFVVKPERRRIAPMDFEKFVLEGSIPADAPFDVYHGAIVVSSGHEISIPVRIVVQAL